jgi:hypothetical protein
LYLAISGLFMIPGRKGPARSRRADRGALIAALTIGYVVLSGGPEAKERLTEPSQTLERQTVCLANERREMWATSAAA